MNLLLTGCFPYTEAQMEMISSLGFTVCFLQQEKDELPMVASDIDATVCNGLFLSHCVDDFARLKFVQLTSAGLDRVPADVLRARGVELFNARGVYAVPMAEWAVFKVLEQYKHGRFFDEQQRVCQWMKHRDLREIAGIKVAVVGAGNVGQEVAKRFKAFGAVTVGFDVHTNVTSHFDQMEMASGLQSQVGCFDVVVVTAPLLPSTRGLLSRGVLEALKENAILVNIARGGLIDEKAMCEVLVERKDLFAALDVFEEEPLPTDSPLWRLENVAVSPHNSFVSNGNNKRMFDVIYRNLSHFIENQR